MNLAQLLNACEKAGIHIRLQDDAVFSRYGYVFRVNNRWVARTLKDFRQSEK